jgi:Histidine kinase
MIDTYIFPFFRRVYAWQRLRVVLLTCFIVCLLFTITWEAPYWMLLSRVFGAGMVALTLFGVFERWPTHLPTWMARWVLQIVMIAISIPISVALGYTFTTWGMNPPWWRDGTRLTGFGTFTFLGLIIAPWIAVAALLKQIKNSAEKQALTFELQRSEYEKQAINARLRLLQAQVEPHFLFNTLANVQELVETGSPRAATVLNSLIAYLRAAVPRLNEQDATMNQEVELVRAYLEVMHMRMPDRLQFTVSADDAAKAIPCPPMLLLTLVENAMRHGIDPAEEGGRIDVRVGLLSASQGRLCHATVTDTGLGLQREGIGTNAGTNTSANLGTGLGTGLVNLRERLKLAYGAEATFALTRVLPHGVRAEIIFPLFPLTATTTPT